MRKYEYKFYQLPLDNLEKELNELGSNGWEIVHYNKIEESLFKKEIEVIISNKLDILNEQFSDEINLENLKKKK